jgi:alpha-L-rhamnosidase
MTATGGARRATAPAAAVGQVSVDVRTSVPEGVLAAGLQPVRLSWRVRSGREAGAQEAYEVEAAADAAFATRVGSTGAVPGDRQLAIDVPGPALRSREARFARARVRIGGAWSPWSDAVRIEAGLLHAADWLARPITLPGDAGAHRQAPAPLLRRVVTLDEAPASARLHVTALGLHDVRINGTRVAADLLAPGWSAYRHRLLADTYDVTGLLVAGENVIAAAIGDGWYRGRLGFRQQGDRCTYGSEVGLIAQLEVESPTGDRRVVLTDGTWRASVGEIRSADLYDGAFVDLRERLPGWDAPGFDDSAWQPARVLELDLPAIEPRTAPPVRVVDVLRAERIERGAGRTRLDGGQNVAGFVRLRVRGSTGTVVRVRHAEVLEPDGSLHLRALRSAKATDTYVLADDAPAVLEPPFTFHGFRYADVETDAEILDAEIVAISSDTPRRSTFACADERVNQLHANVAWSQRDNFVSVPTDCPQRDERLGWTGDAQAFAATGSTLFEAEAFWRSWLRDLALEQDLDLGVPSVVPNVVLEGPLRMGRAGWADAATIVPWAVYEAYGDASVLDDQRRSMREWVDSLAARRGDDGLLVPSPQFGDWLDPDAPAARPWEAKVDSELLANAFFAHSARLVADAARLGGDATAAGYEALSRDVAARTWEHWRDDGLTTQTGCAAVLRLGIAPDGERARAGEALAALVRAADGRVATGFLGTPLVLPALSETGHVDEAYRMLLRRDPPSWLYQVDRGATTVWERWDAILPDGSIHPGTMTHLEGDDAGGDSHMLSFNHYAYGAVIDWVYRHVAGIAPTVEAPGYRRVLVGPRPHASVRWAKASIESAYGAIGIDWRLHATSLVIDLELPFGVDARLDVPVGPTSRVRIDGGAATADGALASGRHRIEVTNPVVAGARRD